MQPEDTTKTRDLESGASSSVPTHSDQTYSQASSGNSDGTASTLAPQRRPTQLSPSARAAISCIYGCAAGAGGIGAFAAAHVPEESLRPALFVANVLAGTGSAACAAYHGLRAVSGDGSSDGASSGAGTAPGSGSGTDDGEMDRPGKTE
jgi:hypothetical protein